MVTVTGTGSAWNNNGDLTIGQFGSGTLNIQNSGAVTVGNNFYITSTSTLGFALASIVDPFLQINNNAWLAGTLDLSLVSGFTPNLGDSFQIMTFASRTGMFDTITGADIGSGLELTTIYSSTAVTLVVIPEPASFVPLILGVSLLALHRRQAA